MCTVLNEINNLPNLLSDLLKQTVMPDETVFVDAGSTDGTKEFLGGKVGLIVKEGLNRSQGRNLAIKNTSAEIVAVCDAGTRLSDDFLENLTSPFSTDSSVDVVSGFFKPDVSTFFEMCLASATIPILDEVEEDKFLPSSRSVAFKKSAWEAVLGYPEWLSVCEDLIFDIKLKRNGFKFKFEPKAIAFWKPQQSINGFFKQYYSYARGDGHAKLWATRHLIRYSAYVTGLLLIYLSVFISPLWLLPLVAAELGYFSKFYYRYMGHFPLEPEPKMLIAFPYISILVIVGDIAKMIGYPLGIIERLSGKIKFEEYRR